MVAPVTDDDFVPPPPRKRKPDHRDESETSRTAKVLSYLKSLPKTHARKVHTGPMGESGHPDIDGCRAGRAFKIEMKKSGEKPTPLQMARLITWQAAGALVGWAESVEHAEQIMAYWDNYEWRNQLTGPGAPPRDGKGRP
jgi:hypothetical protein